MADNSPIGLGSGNDAAWVTVHGSGDGATAVWAGYGDHGPGDVAVDAAVRSDSGAYDPRKDVDEILADAKGGLEWFKLVRERYFLAGGAADIPGLGRGGMDELYYQQRDMRMNNLFGAGQRIQDMLPKIDQARGDHQQATARLGGYWQGPTGETARTKLSGLGDWSDQTYDTVQVVPGVLSGVVDGVKSCVQRKADAFAKLDKVRHINNVDMGGGDINSSHKDDAAADSDDVTLIIQYAKRAGIGDNARRRIQVLAENGAFGGARLPHYIPKAANDSGGAGSTEAGMTKFDDAAQALCKVWTGHFKESVEGYFRAYSTLCEETHTAIKEYLGVATDALGKVGRIEAPPMPKDTGAPGGWVPSGGGDSTGGGGTPSMLSTSPAGVLPDATVPASAVPVAPATPTPTSGPDVLSTLNSVAGGAGQFIQQGFSQLSSTLEGLTKTASVGTTPNAAGETSMVPGSSASAVPGSTTPGQLLSVNLPGGRLVLTRSGDEALTATLTTPDGKTQRYTLAVKDGKPVLTAESDPSTTAAATESRSGNDTDPQSAASHPAPVDAHHTATPDNTVYQQPSTGLPMGMGAAGAAAKPAENDSARGSIAPPRPLWTDDPGREARPVPSEDENPTTATPPVVPTVRADGVKIEIEMGGDQRGAMGTR
ncbi:hypothetical protein GPX89_30415 [Nocardia sp. ET3-3]|uniref:Uncharacterized protein n=1 Tax=Nocardia terrae TaxID=2675851 RepID=A0A7K1V4X8_9NOCA|nr:hypothetical protein [Nocardia terrae]MVU81542.1 hypothetical protein [Nocardia terrae]